VLADQTIDELKKRFRPAAARNVSATYLIVIRGEGGGAWLTKISDGTCEFIPHYESGSANGDSQAPADCSISVDAADLELIMTGRLSAMTAALSGVLAIEGELGLAMQLVPIFFEGQAPFV
jgi:putative sterol carrier protein